MAKKKTETGILLRGIYIEPNTVYEIGPKKPGEGAPDIYKKLGSEKYSAPGNSIMNQVGFPFINGLWDTGFYPTSPIFNEQGINIENAEIVSKAYSDFILEPLRASGLKILANNLEEYENPNSVTFKDMMVPVYIGQQFNTGIPQDRLALYTIIMSGSVAPQGKANKEQREKGVRSENEYYYNDAQYTIVSKTLSRSVEERREYNNTRARGIFYNMLENNKEDLVALMNYEGIPSDVTNDDFSLTQAIGRYFNSDDNIESFLDTYTRYKENDNFKEEVKIMAILVNERGLRYLKKEGRQYLLNGVEIGTGLKPVAKNIANDKKLTKEFYKLLELE